jgi:hypothetical protein
MMSDGQHFLKAALQQQQRDQQPEAQTAATSSFIL